MNSNESEFYLRCTDLVQPYAYFGILSGGKDIMYWHLFGLELNELKLETECHCLTKPKYKTYPTLVESVTEEFNDFSMAICYQSGLHFALFLKGNSPTRMNIYSVIVNSTLSFMEHIGSEFYIADSTEEQSCFQFTFQENNQFNNLRMYVLYQFNSNF